MQKQTIPAAIGLLILRAGIGGYMVTHGWGKLQMVLDGNYAMFGDPIGIGPHASLLLTAFAEFVCAALVVAGLGTRFAAIPVVVAMGVAAFVAHGADPWSMETAAIRFMTGESESWGSKQPALMFLIPFLALAFTGPGRFSLDALVHAWWEQRKGEAPPQAAGG
jgi:putative oxidoreductase